MAALASDAAVGLWHAFEFFDEHKNGQVQKSKLKVLTANLCTVLDSPSVENGLQDFRSTSYLVFEDYIYYLRKELFSALSTSMLDPRDPSKYLTSIEETCWLVCRSKYLKRDQQALPDNCVFQLFRVFCLLAEQIPGSKANPSMVTMALPSEEVEYIVRHFVVALGKEWDRSDFAQIAEVVQSFKFEVFLALVETSYSKNVEMPGLVEATQEVYEMLVEDVLKKGILSRKGNFFSTWKAFWFVLKPLCLTFFSDRSEKGQRGEISIHGQCSVESVSESPNGRGNKFSLSCGDKCFEFMASDHKTKLQWMTALQTAIDHHGRKETYQKRLASRRKNERDALKAAKLEEETSLVYQQSLLEKQRSELEAEKLARIAAEAEARNQANLREQEAQRLKELEAAKKELEHLLEVEKQAKRDEEIVRNLQARLLREEWEKREELEQLQERQSSLLAEEKTKREGLQQEQQLKEKQLEEAKKKLAELEREKGRLDRQLKEVQGKVEVAERAKEVLESKLRVREKSYIPVRRGPQIHNENGPSPKMTDLNSNKKNSRRSMPTDGEKEGYS